MRVIIYRQPVHIPVKEVDGICKFNIVGLCGELVKLDSVNGFVRVKLEQNDWGFDFIWVQEECIMWNRNLFLKT